MSREIALHFGTGYTTPLPAGWALKEKKDDWALGIAPSGKEYYLGPEFAYPRRVATKKQGSFKPGDFYIDTENGVVRLTSAQKANTGVKPRQSA